MPLTFNSFFGANNSLEPRLLDPSVGTESVNQRPGKGDFRPWKQATAVATVPAGRKTIYRMGADVANDALYWLTWSGIVNVIRGFDPDDTTEKTYFTGDGSPKWTDNTIGLAGAPYPSAARELAMPAPTTGMTVAINTAADSDLTEETWFYVHTFVNDVGWESAPSPPSAPITAQPGTTVDLAGLEAAPSGAYGINRRRIYKTKTGTSGVAEYFFLMEIGIGASSVLDDARELGTDALPTVGWLPPPAGAHGITTLWNGMVSVLSEKSARVSEPFQFYAYPLAYEIATSDKAVAQVAWGQNLLILTTGDPVLVSGADPAALDAQPTKLHWPCSSPRSVVSFGNGVVWASPKGLCWFDGQSGGQMITEGLIDPEPNPDNPSGLSWSEMHPETMVCSRYLGNVVVFYDSGAGMRGLVIPLKQPSLYFLSTGYDAVFRDPVTDALYVLSGTTISRFDASTSLMSATFRSKAVRMPRQVSFACGEVVARGYPVSLTLWVDGAQKLLKSVANDDPFRLPDGCEGEEFQVEITSGAGSVSAVRLGTNIRDLSQP